MFVCYCLWLFFPSLLCLPLWVISTEFQFLQEEINILFFRLSKAPIVIARVKTLSEVPRGRGSLPGNRSNKNPNDRHFRPFSRQGVVLFRHRQSSVSPNTCRRILWHFGCVASTQRWSCPFPFVDETKDCWCVAWQRPFFRRKSTLIC